MSSKRPHPLHLVQAELGHEPSLGHTIQRRRREPPRPDDREGDHERGGEDQRDGHRGAPLPVTPMPTEVTITAPASATRGSVGSAAIAPTTTATAATQDEPDHQRRLLVVRAARTSRTAPAGRRDRRARAQVALARAWHARRTAPPRTEADSSRRRQRGPSAASRRPPAPGSRARTRRARRCPRRRS